MNRLLQLLLLIACIYSAPGYAQTKPKTKPKPKPKHAEVIAEDGPQFKYLVGSNSYDYGRIGKNTSATYQFEFKNSGKKTLVIYEAHADAIIKGGYVHIVYPKKMVKPKRTGHIIVTVDAGDETGSFRGDIYVTSNVTKDSYPLLHISGAIVATANRYESKPDINPTHNGGTVSPESALFEIVGNALIYLTEKK